MRTEETKAKTPIGHPGDASAVGAAPRFHRLTSSLAPLPVDDIDTDQIIPAEYLKATDRAGMGKGLFALWRRDPDFVLNRPEHKDARILLAGENFGCGSSREHAPWALLDHGFQAVLSSRFADIFRTNALGNGLLPVEISPDLFRRLLAMTQADPATQITLDLESQTLTLPDEESTEFQVDPFARTCLLEGVDTLGYLLRHDAAIARHEEGRPSWLDTRRSASATRSSPTKDRQ